MKERPIPFNGAMVREILNGSKTQTRRVVKLELSKETMAVDHVGYGEFVPVYQVTNRANGIHGPEQFRCPYGQPGDRLWVRESARVMAVRGGIREIDIEYQADGTKATVKYPSRLAPAPLGKLLSNGTYREASRILLEITTVRVERLQDISEADAQAEGVCTTFDRLRPNDAPIELTHKAEFRDLWQSINGPDTWDANPWVWVVEFNRVQP